MKKRQKISRIKLKKNVSENENENISCTKSTFGKFEHALQDGSGLCTINIDFEFRYDIRIDWASVK